MERRDLRADDVAVRVDYCGVCHSDLHALRDHGGRSAGGDEAAGASAAAAAAADETAEATDGGSSVPLVPGHEFIGVVTEIGPEVQRFAIGDVVAVGNIVDACLVCDMCTAGQENFCREFPTLTYGGVDRRDGRPTLGAYAREYVVREEFAHRVPEGLDPSA
ncbi:MAG: alcohol dehydrogenase catalytic domain-containing protein, partial [Brachybacterium tyrofermentans]